jgi:hypothetical protein
MNRNYNPTISLFDYSKNGKVFLAYLGAYINEVKIYNFKSITNMLDYHSKFYLKYFST